MRAVILGLLLFQTISAFGRSDVDATQSQITDFLEELVQIRGGAGTPLQHKIFGGEVDGQLYAQWLSDKAPKLGVVERLLLPFLLLRAKVIAFSLPGNQYVPLEASKQTIFLGPAFFAQLDPNEKWDFVRKAAALLGSALALKQDKPRFDYLNAGFMGYLASHFFDDLNQFNDESIDGPDAAELVFLYNMALSLPDEHWGMDKFKFVSDRLTPAAREEIAKDLAGTPLAEQWSSH